MLIEGLCAYLDPLPPLLNCTGLMLSAWNLLVQGLVSICTNCVAAYKAVQEIRAEARRFRITCDLDRVDEAEIELQKAYRTLQEAVDCYYGAQRVLQSKAWWLDCHLQLPQKRSKIETLLEQGSANAETLAAVAFVHVAMVHAVEVQHGAEVKLGLVPATLPLLLDSHGTAFGTAGT